MLVVMIVIVIMAMISNTVMSMMQMTGVEAVAPLSFPR